MSNSVAEIRKIFENLNNNYKNIGRFQTESVRMAEMQEKEPSSTKPIFINDTSMSSNKITASFEYLRFSSNDSNSDSNSNFVEALESLSNVDESKDCKNGIAKEGSSDSMVKRVVWRNRTDGNETENNNGYLEPVEHETQSHDQEDTYGTFADKGIKLTEGYLEPVDGNIEEIYGEVSRYSYIDYSKIEVICVIGFELLRNFMSENYAKKKKLSLKYSIIM